MKIHNQDERLVAAPPERTAALIVGFGRIADDRPEIRGVPTWG